MIKLFRRIRKKLLEENRLSKYLVYAAGEIILVMIGILLAMQVSNWSKQKSDKSTKVRYCHQLLEELQLDKDGLDRSIDRLEEALEAYDEYDATYEKANLPLDTIYKNIKKLPSGYYIAVFNTKTLDVLKSTGDIKLLPSDIQEVLISLENEQTAYLSAHSINYDIYLRASDKTYLINTFSIENKIHNQDRFARALHFRDRLPEQLAIQHAAYASKRLADEVCLRTLGEILVIEKELEELLKKEIKK